MPFRFGGVIGLVVEDALRDLEDEPGIMLWEGEEEERTPPPPPPPLPPPTPPFVPG